MGGGWRKKVNLAHARLPSVGFRSWSQFLAVSLQVTWVINPAVGCHYFLPGLQLPLQHLKGLLPILLLGEQRYSGCEQFAYDCYPTVSRLQSEPGPFYAWVQHANHSAIEPPRDGGAKCKKDAILQSVINEEPALAMTSSTVWWMTRSARLSSRVAWRLTMTTRPPAFLVISGRLAHGKICRDVPKHTQRSAHLHRSTYSSSPVRLSFWYISC